MDEKEKLLVVVGRLTSDLFFQFTNVVSGQSDAPGTANVTIKGDAALPVVKSSGGGLGGGGGEPEGNLVLGQDFLAPNHNPHSRFACHLEEPSSQNKGYGWLYLLRERVKFDPKAK